MHRPKDWKNPYDGECGTNGYLHIGSVCPHCLFEAGADAMLESLLKTGEYEHGDCDESCSERNTITIRFDPNEE